MEYEETDNDEAHSQQDTHGKPMEVKLHPMVTHLTKHTMAKSKKQKNM